MTDLERVERRAAAAAGDSVLSRLEQLSRERREAIKGQVLNEKSYSELAQRLRCSEAVMRQRVSRGLAKLRVQITKETY